MFSLSFPLFLSFTLSLSHILSLRHLLFFSHILSLLHIYCHSLIYSLSHILSFSHILSLARAYTIQELMNFFSCFNCCRSQQLTVESSTANAIRQPLTPETAGFPEGDKNANRGVLRSTSSLNEFDPDVQQHKREVKAVQDSFRVNKFDHAIFGN